MRRQFVFVTAGKWQIPAIKKAKEMGFSCVGIDTRETAEGLEYCDYKITGLDLDSQSNLILDEVLRNKHEIAGCISYCSDAGQALADKLKNHFNLPGDTSQNTANFLDKSLQRLMWSQLSDKSFTWEEFSDPETALKSLKDLRKWKVVKPIDGSGSRGVFILRRGDNFKNAIREAFANSKSNRIIVEDFVPGIEYTVDSIVLSGEVHTLLITRKKKVSEKLLTVAKELQVVHPSDYVWYKINEKATQAIRTLGMGDGTTHLELIMNKDGHIHVVEASARGGGFGLASDLIPMATGIDYTEISLKIASGMPISEFEIHPKETKFGVMKFITSKEGVVKKISGAKEAVEKWGVLCEVLVKVGDRVGAAKSDGDRIARIIAVGDSVNVVKSIILKAEKEVCIEIS